MTRLLALLSTAVLLATGCAAGGEAAGGEAGGATPADPGEGLAAVATVFPLAWMAQQVAPGAEHTYLAARGQDPHDLELTPGDRALLETADVVVYMGAVGFQPQVETAVAGREGATVDVHAVTGERALLDRDHDDHGHDDDDHDDHDDEDQPFDPHVWFDAAVMADVAREVGEAFAQADPARADAYREAAQALHDDLRALDADLDALLSGCAHDTAIVSHEAYAYLLAPRDLAQEGISGAGGHGEASPQRLADLTQRIHHEGIPAVLAEPVEGRADAEALAREAGVDLLEIDPLEIADDEAFSTGYLALLRHQAERFAEALGCG